MFVADDSEKFNAAIAPSFHNKACAYGYQPGCIMFQEASADARTQIAFFFFPPRIRSSWVFLFIATMSHGVVDAFTDGGHGVGFFIPWDNTRYFFPFHPIEVSPLGISRFFTGRGFQVLYSEAIWIGIPVVGFLLMRSSIRRSSRD